jgi:hypothetical protein
VHAHCTLTTQNRCINDQVTISPWCCTYTVNTKSIRQHGHVAKVFTCLNAAVCMLISCAHTQDLLVVCDELLLLLLLPLLLLVTDSCCSSEDCAAASMIAGALLVSSCTHTAPGTADSDFAAAGAVACMALASLFSNHAPAIAARLCTLPLRVLSVQLQLLLVSTHSKPQHCTHTGLRAHTHCAPATISTKH